MIFHFCPQEMAAILAAIPYLSLYWFKAKELFMFYILRKECDTKKQKQQLKEL